MIDPRTEIVRRFAAAVATGNDVCLKMSPTGWSLAVVDARTHKPRALAAGDHYEGFTAEVLEALGVSVGRIPRRDLTPAQARRRAARARRASRSGLGPAARRD